MTPRIVDRAGHTQTGHVRRSNEDSYLMREPLFMVADGMGGAAAGEIASRMCAEAFAEIDLIRTRGTDALTTAIRTANARIHERAAKDLEVSGMGTTVTAALVAEDGSIAFAHVGDSRAYLMREGELRRLSEDHSVVAELVASGQLTEEEAERHPQRSVITRALGAEASVQVDSFTLPAQAGDVILLCTDGLTGMIDEGRVAALLDSGKECEQIARDLIRAALAGGGEDNVTAIVFRMGDEDADQDTQRHTARMVLTVDPDLEDPIPARPPRSRRRTVATAVLVAAVIALLAGGVYLGLRESHFVGADETTGHVVVYQGLPIDLWGGVTLYHTVYDSHVAYASLPEKERKRLFDHTLRTYGGALAVVHTLQRQQP